MRPFHGVPEAVLRTGESCRSMQTPAPTCAACAIWAGPATRTPAAPRASRKRFVLGGCAFLSGGQTAECIEATAPTIGRRSVAAVVGVEVTTPREGDAAPSFALLDQPGDRAARGYRGAEAPRLLLSRGGHPGCTVQSCDLRDHRQDFAGIGLDVVGISPDRPEKQMAFDEKYSLEFPLLADEDHAVADAFGAWGEKHHGGHTYHGIVRSSFLVDEEGRIERAWSPVTPEDTVPNALAAVKEG